MKKQKESQIMLFMAILLVMTQAQLMMTKTEEKSNCRYNFILQRQHLNSENTDKKLTHTIFMLHVRSP
jgi:hypothetical protein